MTEEFTLSNTDENFVDNSEAGFDAGNNGKTCHRCGEVGHISRDCTQIVQPKNGEVCFQCGSNEHYSSQCPGKELEVRVRVSDEDLKAVWDSVVEADADNEFEDIKANLIKYAESDPTLTWIDIDEKLSSEGLKTVIIAEERLLPPNKDLVNNQDEGNQRYEVVFMRNPRLIRKRFPDQESKDENKKKIAEAGLIKDRQRIMGKYDVPEWAMAHLSLEQRAMVVNGCSNCGEESHRVKYCPYKVTTDVGKCYKCGNTGHSHRDCTEGRSNRDDKDNSCHKCGETGHFASACPTKVSSFTCYNCGEEGHRSNECEKPRKARACYKCGDEDHLANNCPKNEGFNSNSGFDDSNNNVPTDSWNQGQGLEEEDPNLDWADN